MQLIKKYILQYPIYWMLLWFLFSLLVQVTLNNTLNMFCLAVIVSQLNIFQTDSLSLETCYITPQCQHSNQPYIKQNSLHTVCPDSYSCVNTCVCVCEQLWGREVLILTHCAGHTSHSGDHQKPDTRYSCCTAHSSPPAPGSPTHTPRSELVN